MKILITGATGFIGKKLCADLIRQGHSLSVLSRDPIRAKMTLGEQVESLAWGSPDATGWKKAVADSEVVINLAGESIAAHRWTPEYQEKLRRSRIDTTRSLVDAMRAAENKPGVFLCTSATGIYGDGGEQAVTEDSKLGTGFLAELTRDWESEARKAGALGVRVALMRVGIVLGEGGGALEKMINPLPVPISPWRLGLGGPLGSGKQWFPWIHLDDVVGMFIWAMSEDRVTGPVNVVAPQPLRNSEFSKALGRTLHRPSFMPVPAFALHLIAGKLADDLLAGQKVIPAVAHRLGYKYHFPDIDSALLAILVK